MFIMIWGMQREQLSQVRGEKEAEKGGVGKKKGK